MHIKKIISGIALALAFVLPAAASAAPAFGADLHYGSTGADVSALQEFLTDQGVYTGPITGNFYSLTLAGVKRFQSAESISPVSGYFGPISRGVANTILATAAPDSEEGAVAPTTTPKDLSTLPAAPAQSIAPSVPAAGGSAQAQLNTGSSTATISVVDTQAAIDKEKALLRATRGIGRTQANVYIADSDQNVFGDINAKKGDVVISVNDFFAGENASILVNGKQPDAIKPVCSNKIAGSTLLQCAVYAVVSIGNAPQADVQITFEGRMQENTIQANATNSIGFSWF